jgi:hypothetical protein
VWPRLRVCGWQGCSEIKRVPARRTGTFVAVDKDRYLEALRPLFDGRRIVCVGATVRSLTSLVGQVRELGASEVLVVGMQGEGSGEPLPASEAKVSSVRIDLDAVFGDKGPSSMDIIRAEEQFKQNPPEQLLHELSQFDPDRSALVLGQFVNTEPFLDGPPFLAYRKPEWIALEDKTLIDPFFDRSGVPRAASETVRVEPALLSLAGLGLDEGRGVVWSGDTRDGFNGGAEYVFWVRDEDTFRDALSFFSGRCDTVRVMPFLHGVPCSIHGIVTPDGVAVLRPVEMVTLVRHPRSPGKSLFTYRGCASFYEPTAEVRRAMTVAARRVGERLRDKVDFRGCFTLDGVVGEHGFFPTEVNPRQGAGLFSMLGSFAVFPVGLVMDAIAVDIRCQSVQPNLRSTCVPSQTRNLREALGRWSSAPCRSTKARTCDWTMGVALLGHVRVIRLLPSCGAEREAEPDS